MFKPTCKICGKEKEVTFKGEPIQYPVYSCYEHPDEDKNEWEIWWTKYHDRYKDKEYWNSLKDRPSCIVGYFCNEFYKHYGYSYKLDYNSPIPYKNREFLVARKLMAMFGEEYLLIPEYIRWVFEKRVKARKKAVTSFGFFITQDFVNSYFAARASRNVLRRSTPLPKEFLEWCKAECPEIFDKEELATWNDLNGLVTYVKCYGENNIQNFVVRGAIDRSMLPGLDYRKLEE